MPVITKGKKRDNKGVDAPVDGTLRKSHDSANFYSSIDDKSPKHSDEVIKKSFDSSASTIKITAKKAAAAKKVKGVRGILHPDAYNDHPSMPELNSSKK